MDDAGSDLVVGKTRFAMPILNAAETWNALMDDVGGQFAYDKTMLAMSNLTAATIFFVLKGSATQTKEAASLAEKRARVIRIAAATSVVYVTNVQGANQLGINAP